MEPSDHGEIYSTFPILTVDQTAPKLRNSAIVFISGYRLQHIIDTVQFSQMDLFNILDTVFILNLWTDRLAQTVQILIRRRVSRRLIRSTLFALPPAHFSYITR